MRIGIVGAGIAGLSAAIALGDEHEITLFERSSGPAAVGAGIVVSANAGRALASIGVALDDVGRRVTTTTIASTTGRPRQQLDLAAGEGRFGPTVAIDRPTLHRRLVDSLPTRVALRFGTDIRAIDVVRANVDAGGSTHTFDLLIGADGINSRVRAALPDAGQVVHAGNACWRALVEPTFDREPTEYIGAGQRMGVVGLTSGTYLYLVESAAPGELRNVDLVGLRERFAGFEPVRPLLDAIEAMPRFDDLAELDRPVWGTRAAVLIGDAAHAMTPNLGQGASMAIEDAVVLAHCLRSRQDWFPTFVEARHQRVRWVQLTSRRLGRLLHARSAPARWLRDGLLRGMPAAAMRRQSERLLGGGPPQPE